MNEYCINALYSGFQGDALAHHGILGMHWGIRRFQPYGQGYDADHEGREVGLAARLGGSGGSFSSTYGRGRGKGSIVERAKSAASKFGKKAYDVSQEAAERLNYGLDRAEKKAREAASKVRSKLENYASQRLDDDLYYRRDTALQERLKRSGLGELLGAAAKTAGHNARKGAAYASPILKDAMQKLRNEPETREKVKSFMRGKAHDVMERTKVASNEFSKNARATASLLAGAFDPRSGTRLTVDQALSSRYSDRLGATRSGRLVSPTGGLLTPGTDKARAMRGMPGFESTAPKAMSSNTLRDNIRSGARMALASRLTSPINQQTGVRRGWDQTPGSQTARGVSAALGELTTLRGESVNTKAPYRQWKPSDAYWNEKTAKYQHIQDRMQQRIGAGEPGFRVFNSTESRQGRAAVNSLYLEPLGQVRSSSSTDIGKRLLGL